MAIVSKAAPESLVNPRLYAEAWIIEKGVELNDEGELVQAGVDSTDSLFNTMWLDYRMDLHEHNVREKLKGVQQRNIINSIRESDMWKAYEEIKNKKKDERRKAMVGELKCTSPDLSELNRWLIGLTGKADEVEQAVFAHFLWSIKRKILKKAVTNHIMPVLYGPQGAGKTVALEKLLEPLEKYILPIQMNEVTDPRNFKAMSENYVILFDEMGGAHKADLDALKNQITTEYNSARRLHTHEVPRYRQSCSFIGASNRPLSTLIKDETGMRRFFQVDTLERIEWETINSINPFLILKGIDENREDGYILTYIEAVRKIQLGTVSKDHLECFLEDLNIEDDPVFGKVVPTSDLYKAYLEHTTERVPMSQQKFSKTMKQKGLSIVKRSNGSSGSINTFKINSDSLIFNNY